MTQHQPSGRNRAPIPPTGYLGRTWQESVPSWPQAVRPPAGTPNVLFIVLDDTGFSHLGCFGSDIQTPNIDALAAGGLRFNNFHTTAICSPTRASLLTGRNPHAVGIGFVAEGSNGFPNTRGKITKETGLISEILKEAGYNTFAVGKWHLMPAGEHSVAGPYDNWPLGRGFERYYGFLGAETSQWHPELTADNHRVEQPRTPEEGYHLTEDLSDKIIEFIRDQKAVAPHKPFFGYLAYGATHAPHHAPKAYIDKYKGRFDKGWDVVRAEWFERQKELGIIPADTTLPPSNPNAQAWDGLSDDEKRLYARMQEIFAGYLEHTDYHIGRVLDFLREIGQFDNTLIVLLSDNGASAEGGPHGSDHEWKSMFLGFEPAAERLLERIDELGTPTTYNHYPIGWAQAGNTPLKWYKRWVHAGGVKDPLIISYPDRIKSGGEIRSQFHHVSDIVPTVLELTGVTPPASINGVQQKEFHGTSLAYAFDDAEAPTHKQTQYFEMLGNRGIWHKGWKAVCAHVPDEPYENDVWELYHVDKDFSESRNLAQERPEKLRELIDLWWAEAGRNGVLPLDDRVTTRMQQMMELAPDRPTTYTYLPGVKSIPTFVAPDLGSKAFTITAEVERPDEHAEGTLVALGGSFGGYAFFVQHNRLVFHYNFLSDTHDVITSTEELPTGPVSLRIDFKPDDFFSGTGKLFANDVQIGEGRLERIFLLGFAIGSFEVGHSGPTPVSPTFQSPFAFSGTLKKVVVTVERHKPPLERALAIELATQ